MPYLIGIALGVAAVYAAIWLLVAGTMWFVVPGLLIVLPLAVLCGVLLAVVSAVLVLTGVWSPPRTVSPNDVVRGTANVLRRRDTESFPRDRAWPSYPVVQGRLDVAQLWRAPTGLLGNGWRWIERTFSEVPGQVLKAGLAWPVWLCVSAGAVVTAAAVVVIVAVLLAVLLVCWAVPVALLRAGDSLVRKWRRASGSCQACYHVTDLPAFGCPTCGELHRDIRPGALGGVWRRCGCGVLLPTSVLRVTRLSEPRCPRCDETLRDGAAVVTDVRVPVFGPVSAGKTRLVYSGLLAVRDGVAAGGGSMDFVGDDSRQAFRHATALIAAGGDTVKTPAGELPRAITARFTAGRRRALLHFFDAAGEFYADREDNSDLEFLDHAQGLVFVVDPFSIPWVRDQIGGGGGSDIVSRANPASEEPERVYHLTANRLRDYGVATRKRRLAMTVVKADLLAGLPFAADLVPGQVREWLVEAGLDNLVLSAERDFGDVRYFVVASVSGMPVSEPRTPAAPIGWLAAAAGVELWPGSADAGSTKEKEEAL